MDWKLAGEIASAVLIVGGTVFMILRHIKERAAKKNGLKGNPERCIIAEKRIVALEISCAETKTELRNIHEKVNDVSVDVKTLIELHLKK